MLLFVLTLALGFSNQANAETTARECLNQTDSDLLVLPPPSGLGLLFSFESRVPAAFPVGTEESKLKSWLSEEGFLYYGLNMDDTAFADEPDENARFRKRLKNDEYVNLSIMSWHTLCGRMVFSVGWHADACGLIDEIYADVESCQFDLP